MLPSQLSLDPLNTFPRLPNIDPKEKPMLCYFRGFYGITVISYCTWTQSVAATITVFYYNYN